MDPEGSPRKWTWPAAGRVRSLAVRPSLAIAGAAALLVLGVMGGRSAHAEAARLDASKSTAFDVLVTDYAMPGMTGGELLARAAVLHPCPPALVITGYADAAELKEVPAHVRVVHKPFRADVLVRHVQGLVGASMGAVAPASPEMLVQET